MLDFVGAIRGLEESYEIGFDPLKVANCYVGQ
jgi:hypothetical protein